ncbi:MAG: heparinase, partial [Firmicutes bacterium]|nr:heparinase [Bacillota bacterium]
CDEGPGYWSKAAGSLFDCLEILTAATAGKINVFNHRLIKEMGRYLVRVHIAGNYFLNFADTKPQLSINSALVWAYGERTGDADLKALAASSRRANFDNQSHSLLRYLRYLFTYSEFDTGLEPPYLGDVWLPDLEVMAAREQPGSSKGLYLAAKGGHNEESHNHNDVGQFLVYLDGNPVLIDPGVGEYTAQTFSHRRYEI